MSTPSLEPGDARNLTCWRTDFHDHLVEAGSVTTLHLKALKSRIQLFGGAWFRRPTRAMIVVGSRCRRTAAKTA
jgi:hypothetical protein